MRLHKGICPRGMDILTGAGYNGKEQAITPPDTETGRETQREKERCHMKRLLALMLMVLLLATGIAAQAEFNEDDFGELFGDFDASDAEAFPDEEDPTDGFDLTFDDGGYSGEWTSVEALNVEFFLPEGWVSGEAAEDEYFFAENGDGTADLGIGIYDDAYDGGELSDWAAANLDADEYIIGTANTQDVVVLKDDEIGRILVLVPNANGYIIGFNFHRDSQSVLSDSFAVEIAGTCTDLWA